MFYLVLRVPSAFRDLDLAGVEPPHLLHLPFGFDILLTSSLSILVRSP